MQIRSGVQAIHEVGIAHTDLKAANVLVKTDEHGEITAFIADFGLAVDKSNPKHLKENIGGTPGWTSPEVTALKSE